MATIRCSVKPCHYYGEGDYCTADEIFVKTQMRYDADDDLGSGRDMEIGDLGRESKGDRSSSQAVTSSHTCCETFRPKGAKAY
jgi:hypothetical protein